MRLYTRVTQLAPAFPFAYSNMGNIYVLQNDLPRALESYTKAIEVSI